MLLGNTQVYVWFSHFKNGEMLIEDLPRSGQPLTSKTEENIVRICELVMEDHRRTIDELTVLNVPTNWTHRVTVLTEI